MRPRLKKCKAAIKRRDVATQTETLDIWDHWHPRVILNRVQHLQRKSQPKEASKTMTAPADKSEIGQLVTVHDKPSRVSKLPYSYRLFARPITNNENANSTLLLDTEEEMLVHNVAFAKPGPLCYKKRLSKRMNKSLTAPLMRQEHEEAEERDLLEPLIENPLETASTPDLLELNVSSIGSIVEYNDQSTQTQNAGSTQENHQGGTDDGSTQVKSAEPPPPPPQNDEDPPPGPSDIDGETNEDPNGEPNGEPIEETQAANTSYRMKVNGVTTTITTGPEDGATLDSSSDESVHDDNHTRNDRRTKFLKIRAHTVHIHNYFYQK